MLGILRKIAFKLAILAGAPLIGTLILSAEIAREDRDRGKNLAAIGSIEDLAELSARMNATVTELQSERANAALSLGLGNSDNDKNLSEQEKKTDAAVAAMNGFLARRDLERLPLKLRDDLALARKGIEGLGATRLKVARGEATIDDVLSYYASVCDGLTDSTAALTRLSDDGELLRALSSLVAAMRVKESESEQHAILAHAFAIREFSPGMFRFLVNQLTEEAVQVESLKSFATHDQVLAYERTLTLPAAAKADAMRKKALTTTEDDFGIDARTWFDTEEQVNGELKKFEQGLAREVRAIAQQKMQAATRALHYNEALVAAVVLVSILLTTGVGRGISRSVGSLAKVTGRIQRDQDFSVRASKTSRDELGALTDAFNAMLQGIQDRDLELSSHRENLEHLVLERTSELSKRNEDMRFVLDTVEQGLVTIDERGVMSAERSRAFDKFFGAPGATVPFFRHMALGDDRLAATLELDWAQITEGVLPLELSLDQAKNRIQVGDAHFALHYNLLLQGDLVTGALLTVSDITADILARRAEAAQAEQIKTFIRLMKDKAGFVEFFSEAQDLVARIRNDTFSNVADKLRAIHTLKGNAALFDVASVADAAHRLEDALLDGAAPHLAEEALRNLVAVWQAFAERVLPLIDEESRDRIEISRGEIEQLLAVARAGGLGENAERLLVSLCAVPVARRFERLSQQLRVLGAKLGKAEIQISTSGGEIRLPDERFLPFWGVLAHVVRNVADHGLESVEQREAAGKPARNRVSLTARMQEGDVLIEISDDGRGIDWDTVAARALALGLPCGTRTELTEALFAPTLSTAIGVSETSGRGVGMNAVRQVCRELGGSCRVESEHGRGTKLTCRLALTEAEAMGGLRTLSADRREGAQHVL